MTKAWLRLCELGNTLRRRGAVALRQEAWLHDCLERNAGTDYGRRYEFDNIRSVDDFRNQVPLVSYEDIAPWIGRISDGEADVLFTGHAIAFERTGGSAGGAKLVPYSEASLKDFRTAILPWLADAAAMYRLDAGCAYWAISPATRQPERTSGGIPIGLPDGAYLGDDALPAFAELSAVPPWVGTISTVSDWQLATLYWLLRRPDLALISVWSPSFFLTILEALESRLDTLKRFLRQGGEISGRSLLPDPLALVRLHTYEAGKDARSLWPALKLVSCWADGSSKPFFDALNMRFPDVAFQRKGLLATEGIVTVPGKDGRPSLAADSGFFEFLEVAGHSRLAHELEHNERYEVVITTAGGLYRYKTGDCVVCEGSAYGLPVLKFVGRLGLTCDLVGEKLTEEFIADCLASIPGFRILVPVDKPKPKYALVMDQRTEIQSESLTALVEDRLARNPQYAYARRMGQLDSLSVYMVPAPLETYMKRAMSNGARLGDVKVPALRAETDWLQTFRGLGS